MEKAGVPGERREVVEAPTNLSEVGRGRGRKPSRPQ